MLKPSHLCTHSKMIHFTDKTPWYQRNRTRKYNLVHEVLVFKGIVLVFKGAISFISRTKLCDIKKKKIALLNTRTTLLNTRTSFHGQNSVIYEMICIYAPLVIWFASLRNWQNDSHVCAHVAYDTHVCAPCKLIRIYAPFVKWFAFMRPCKITCMYAHICIASHVCAHVECFASMTESHWHNLTVQELHWKIIPHGSHWYVPMWLSHIPECMGPFTYVSQGQSEFPCAHVKWLRRSSHIQCLCEETNWYFTDLTPMRNDSVRFHTSERPCEMTESCFIWGGYDE